jgi:osmotically-inducible protein OsmY
MAEHELWRDEGEQRRRIMEQMDEDRAARFRYAMASGRGGADEEADYRRRMEEQRAAAAGGHRGRGPRGYKRSDERITEDLNDRLTEDPGIDASEVQVQVSGGEVTLTGTVDSREARRRAEDIAEAVSGVSYVMNNLRVRQPGTTGATG